MVSTEHAVDPTIEGPLDMVTASDLAEDLPPLTTDATRLDAINALAHSKASELPVISRETGHLAGIVRKQQQATESR